MGYKFYGWETADIKDASGRTPRDYYDLLTDVWCEETCAPKSRVNWSEENKTAGQCSITSFAIQDIYGGKVFGIPLDDGNYHCFNVVGDCVFDLTSEQFGDQKLDYENVVEQDRAVHFANEDKKKRYELLKERLMKRIEMEDTVISVDRMRRSDAYTIANYVPGKELMYRAADGVYHAYDEWQGKKIAIVVGGGNNGGDGYALAGILKKEGIDSVIYEVSDRPSEDGKYYRDIASGLGVAIETFDSDTDLSGYDVIVDCVLGTGFKGEVRGKAGDAIRAINDADAYVISVDINSGMNGDTGEAPLAVKSDITVSIGYYKQGLFRGDAEKYIGKLTNVEIGIVLVEE